MKSPEKHKPLSPEELFEWLDKKSGKGELSSFSNKELDEFEKAAMEGFESLDSKDKAKALMDEVNLEISKKIQGNGSSRKSTVLWFSAAASLVLVITLSIFLINKTQKETESNIALNNVTAEDTGNNTTLNEEPAKIPEASVNETITGKEALKNEKEIETEGSKQMPLEKLAEENFESAAKGSNSVINTGVAVNGAEIATISQNQVDLSKNKDNANANLATKADADIATVYDAKAVMPISQDIETKKKAKEEDKNLKDETAVTKAEESFARAEEVVVNEKVKHNDLFKERKVAKKAAVNKSADMSPNYLQNTATTTIPSGYVTDAVYKVAKYENGESSIKAYVLEYLKKKSISQIMEGSFKITGKVDEKGKFMVESLNSINDVCKDCESTLKNSLNEMPNWKPASQSGKTVSSNTSFTLNF